MPLKLNRFTVRVVLFLPAAAGLMAASAFLLSTAPTQAQMQAASPYAYQEDVASASLLNAGLAPALEAGNVLNQNFSNASALRTFYQKRNNEPVWLKGYGRYQPTAEQILNILHTSWTHGLNPENYHVDEIKRLMNNPTGANRFALELLLSDAVMRYGRDLTGMRIDPGAIRQKSKYWRQPKRGLDILEHVAVSQDIEEAFRQLEPFGTLYGQLRRELVRLLKENDTEHAPVSLNGFLRPGDGHKKILEFRIRMGLDPEEAPQGKYYYDDQLAQAIMEFQRESGLNPDGVIGPKTVDMLNITNEDKINQVLANLERLRWLDQERPEKYVLVNIPSATLWAVENGSIELQMPVIVGNKVRPTNSFKTEITGIRFNPNWTVPPTIKRVDYLPKLRQDPHYLTSKGIELIKGYGSNARTLDPASINWENISSRELHSIRMVQSPGRNNPLGRVRVIMQNPYNIYLHDTNKPEYFEKQDRTLSSGCIRMAEPEKLAQFVLKHNSGWSEAKMSSILNTGRLTEVDAEVTMPVYILYQTIWQDENGKLVYGRDIYKEDQRLVSVLKETGEIYLPNSSQLADYDPAQSSLAFAGLTP